MAGRNFGTRGRLEVDGIALESAAVRSWNDNLIVFVMPRDVRSGMVRVQTEVGTSNPHFLTSQSDLPRLGSPRGVQVRNLSRREAGPGAVVRIRGENFGPRPARGALSFVYPEGGERLTFSADSWWITHWTNRELVLLIPPYLPPGLVHLEIAGEVMETDLTVLPPTATVSRDEEEPAILRQSLRVGLREEAELPEVRVLLPRLPVLPTQPETELLEERGDRTGEDAPAYRTFRPVAEEVPEGGEGDTAETDPTRYYEVARVERVQRQSVRWSIDSVAPVETLLQDDFRRAFLRFLTDRDGVPTFLPLVGEIRRSSINLRNTPLVIARLIHREVQRRLEPDPEGTQDLEEALRESAGASAQVYADLAAALLRLSGLPARRHFGLLLADDDSVRDHVWIEVFLPAVGWVPMDPALGDGMYGEEFSRVLEFYGDNRTESTLGSLDGRRITVHVDGTANPRLFSGGALVRPADGLWSGRVLRIESGGAQDLEALDVLWSRPYVHRQN